MKRIAVLALFLLVAMLPACQCDTPPPVGPVDDTSVSTFAHAPTDVA